MAPALRDRIVKRTLMNVSNSVLVVANVELVSILAVLIGKHNWLLDCASTFSILKIFDFSCKCGQYGVCGRNCHLEDPCIHDVCANGGICIENCSEVADYYCNCTSQFTGKNCTEEVSVRIWDSRFSHRLNCGFQLAWLYLIGWLWANLHYVFRTNSIFLSHPLTIFTQDSDNQVDSYFGYWYSYPYGFWTKISNLSFNFMSSSAPPTSSYVCFML